jgi:crossover junction endodeoxyribonuclease RuvC
MIIGIDPGMKGGIAVLGEEGGRMVFADGMRMPLIDRGKRQIVDAKVIHALLSRYAIEAIIIELTHAMPGQGVSSMFAFGHATGVATGVAYLHTPRPISVTPQVWKAHFCLGRDKHKSLAMARATFAPHFQFSKLADDGVAEAALIALWYHDTKTDTEGP